MIPNIITSIRIALALPIALLILRGRPGDYPIAGALIIAALITDGLDGFAARRLKMASLFGAMFDLTADRFVITPALFLLSIGGRFAAAAPFFPLNPWPYSGYVILGDFATLTGIAVFVLRRRSDPSLEFPPPPFINKITYSLQLLPILYVCFFQKPGLILAVLMYIAVFFTFLSTIAYIKKGGYVITGRRAKQTA